MTMSMFKASVYTRLQEDVVELTPQQLSYVVAEVRDAVVEHGLTACFAFAEAMRLSVDTPTAAVIRDIRLAESQWLCIAREIADSVGADATGDYSDVREVVRDWTELGPRPFPPAACLAGTEH